jgi:hypothetical protein
MGRSESLQNNDTSERVPAFVSAVSALVMTRTHILGVVDDQADNAWVPAVRVPSFGLDGVQCDA